VVLAAGVHLAVRRVLLLVALQPAGKVLQAVRGKQTTLLIEAAAVAAGQVA
jgi:hypothetical protein